MQQFIRYGLILLLLAGISVLVESSAAFAHSTKNCENFNYPTDVTIPESLSGNFYTFSFSDTTNNLIVMRVNQDEQVVLDLPTELEPLIQAEQTIPRRLSPTGRFMFFSPNLRRNEDTPFFVWNLETDEVVEFRLTDNFMLAWREQNIRRWIFRDAWIDDNTLSIEIYGDRQTNLQGRQLVSFSTSPFTAVLGEDEIFIESDWTEEGKDTYGVFFSPNLTYAIALIATPFENTVLNPATTRIYRRNSRELVYEFIPTTLERRVVGEPIWSADERHFIQTRTDERFSYREALVVDVESDFTEVTNFNTAISLELSANSFFYLPQIRPTWSNDGSKVAIGIESTLGIKYVVIYDFPSNTAHLFCDGGEARFETTIPFWSQDDAYFGYNQSSGRTYAFELATGNTYRFPDTFEFLGWIPEGRGDS